MAPNRLLAWVGALSCAWDVCCPKLNDGAEGAADAGGCERKLLAPGVDDCAPPKLNKLVEGAVAVAFSVVVLVLNKLF